MNGIFFEQETAGTVLQETRGWGWAGWWWAWPSVGGAGPAPTLLRADAGGGGGGCPGLGSEIGLDPGLGFWGRRWSGCRDVGLR